MGVFGFESLIRLQSGCWLELQSPEGFSEARGFLPHWLSHMGVGRRPQFHVDLSTRLLEFP